MARAKRFYVVCLGNEGFEASLELRKLYVALGAAGTEEPGYLRVIDESGEDYLYPARLFQEIAVPRKLARALSA
jgi:hypothetical protein